MNLLNVLSVVTVLGLLSGVALASDRTLTSFDGEDSLRWRVVNDGVMGGLSRGDVARTEDGTLRFAGEISLENNGGFSSIRTRAQDLRLGEFDGLEIRVRGDGRTYKLSLRSRDASSWIAYWADFETRDEEWITVRIPFTRWVPTTFGRELRGPKLNPASINSVGFMLYDKKPGPFALEVDSISAYREDSEPESPAGAETSTILETAEEAGRFRTLLAAAHAAGLVEALSGPGPLTLFAPSDTAFEKLPEGTVEKLLEPANRGALRSLLLHHVVAGDVSLPSLLRASRPKTLAGQRLRISTEGGALKVGEAAVTDAGLRCDNGVIHVVDRVLLPEKRDLATVAVEAKTFRTLVAAARAAGLLDALTGDDPLTVFAPTDDAFAGLPAGTVDELLEPGNRDALTRLLLHHVVKGRVHADAAAAAGEATTLAGTRLRFGYSNGLVVNGTRIVATDLDARNGVIHVVDAVLLPPELESSAEASVRTPATAAARVIELAIRTGAPLFNDGDVEACCGVYDLAIAALLGLDEELLPAAVRTQLRSALDSGESPRDRAWTLRRALDAAYRHVREG